MRFEPEMWFEATEEMWFEPAGGHLTHPFLAQSAFSFLNGAHDLSRCCAQLLLNRPMNWRAVFVKPSSERDARPEPAHLHVLPLEVVRSEW